MKTVKEISELTGISIRALRYYDEIGLLVPTDRTDAGYRLYDDEALEKLRAILFLKELDIPLDTIKEMVNAKNCDYGAVLKNYRKNIVQKINRLQGLLGVVDGMEFVVAKKTTAATKLGEEDEVLTVCPLEENDTLVMATKKDMFLRIDCAQIPQKKKGAVGVRGMKLAAGDELKSIHVLHEGEEKEVEVKGKPVALHRLHVGNRDTKGVKK